MQSPGGCETGFRGQEKSSIGGPITAGCSPSEFKYVKLTREGKILIIFIDNPPHNTLPTGFFRELHSCCDLILSTEIRAVILTGRGNNFSKGADIQEMRSDSNRVDIELIEDGNNLLSFLSTLKKPVIAAINGACLGGGLELALACHIRLCSKNALLGLPEVSIGVIPALGGIQRLVETVGASKALEMILLGDIISARQALELRLVNRVLPKENFLGQVLSFTKTILSAQKDALEAVIGLVSLSRPKSDADLTCSAAQIFKRLLRQGN